MSDVDAWLRDAAAKLDTALAADFRTMAGFREQYGRLRWGDLPGMDYSHGFPMSPHLAEWVGLMPKGERAATLQRLEAAAFAALTKHDIGSLPEWGLK